MISFIPDNAGNISNDFSRLTVRFKNGNAVKIQQHWHPEEPVNSAAINKCGRNACGSAGTNSEAHGVKLYCNAFVKKRFASTTSPINEEVFASLSENGKYYGIISSKLLLVVDFVSHALGFHSRGSKVYRRGRRVLRFWVQDIRDWMSYFKSLCPFE